ncbi:hypothetical protein [Chenggangzhangella methanolivorans]|uniref:hypothetical protein n=1 Tax=Chenggangzhangella methanolivorans TaxID=1437009 RepID=UPI00366E7498
MASRLELELYQQNGGMITASGEIEAQSSTIAQFKSRQAIEFVTSDGHRINLALSDPKRSPTGTIAQITATGDLPSMKGGALGWR